MKTPSLALSLIATLLLVDACGSPDGGGTGGTGVTRQIQSVGTINAKNTAGTVVSVQLNGVHFDISQATVTKEGTAATNADLRVGMVVTVKGQVDANGTTGKATSVAYRDRVLGTLTAIDTSSLRLTILGQAVHLSADTMLYDEPTQTAIAPAVLAAGDYVEVSGFNDAQNVLQASYLARKPAAQRFEVKGNISQLNIGAQRFHIGGLTVDYSDAEIEIPTLRNGDALVVSGRQYNANAEVLTADTVDGEVSDLDTSSGGAVELEGVVTTMPSADRFTVGLQMVQTDANTVYRNGTVVLNARVTARGTMDSNGVLIARSVEIH